MVQEEDVTIKGNLVELVVEAIYLLMWRGISGSSKESWKVNFLPFAFLHSLRPGKVTRLSSEDKSELCHVNIFSRLSLISIFSLLFYV